MNDFHLIATPEVQTTSGTNPSISNSISNIQIINGVAADSYENSTSKNQIKYTLNSVKASDVAIMPSSIPSLPNYKIKTFYELGHIIAVYLSAIEPINPGFNEYIRGSEFHERDYYLLRNYFRKTFPNEEDSKFSLSIYHKVDIALRRYMIFLSNIGIDSFSQLEQVISNPFSSGYNNIRIYDGITILKVQLPYFVEIILQDTKYFNPDITYNLA
ncbi:uncharacterized protein RJT21DRAFT_33877 [Scheffersomyces amazonensis]|uniref:uncharacterized protein n=1 Tax=Scheffersomyces amazonensis TaxID=1078765 RepID=UPI00315D119F